MKSVLNLFSKTAEKPFPKLMKRKPGRGSDCVVLFETSERGVIVSGRGNHGDGVGKITGIPGHGRFAPDSFEDFDGTVTLSND